MYKSSLFKIYVSYFPSKESRSTATLIIRDVLLYVKNGKYKDIIEGIRNDIAIGQINRAKQKKGTLPAVTFSGLYPKCRRDGYCTQYNNLIVIDIDHLSNEQIDRIGEQLQIDSYVAAFWKSPSGNGYKGLIHLLYDRQHENINIRDKHKVAFDALREYMLATYDIELDSSGSDPTRLCFMSYDSDLLIKDFAEDFVVSVDNLQCNSSQPHANNIQENNIEHELFTFKGYNWNKLIGQKWDYQDYKLNKQTIYSILRKMKRKKISITSTYEDWVKVAHAIANSMHPAVGKNVFMQMCELDGVDHNPAKSERLIYDAYCRNNGNVHFETIIYLAKQKGVIV